MLRQAACMACLCAGRRGGSACTHGRARDTVRRRALQCSVCSGVLLCGVRGAQQVAGARRLLPAARRRSFTPKAQVSARGGFAKEAGCVAQENGSAATRHSGSEEVQWWRRRQAKVVYVDASLKC